MRKHKSLSTRVFYGGSYSFIVALAFICLLPFVMIISGSLSDNARIGREGFSILPRGFSTAAYETLFSNAEKILRAYGVTIFLTVVGIVISLTVLSMTAYVISRKDYKYRTFVTFIFYFTTLFNGGIVSTYVFFIKYYNLKDNLFAIILAMGMNVFYLLIMRNFVNEVPTELYEAARIDGAGDFGIFIKIVLPLIKPGLATIGLFLALEFWNDWYNTMLYISESEKFTLQYLLYNMLTTAEGMSKMTTAGGAGVALPSQTMKLAMTVVATGPILLVYPFVQKFFVKGVTAGAVKG